VGVGVLGLVGTSVSATLGASMHLELRARAWSVGLEGRLELPTQQGVAARERPRIEAGTTLGTRLSLATASVCFHRWVFSGCALLGAGLLTTSVTDATGAPRESPTVPAYLSTGLRGAVEFPLGRGLGLRVRAELSSPLGSVAVRATDPGVPPVTLWTTPSLAAALGLDLRVEL
jgi:hypothetical protein